MDLSGRTRPGADGHTQLPLAELPQFCSHARSTPSKQAWLTPGVKGIGGASLLADIGHEIPTSLLPALLTGTLGAPAAALGVIEGVADGLAGAARFGGGRWLMIPAGGARSLSADMARRRCCRG